MLLPLMFPHRPEEIGFCAVLLRCVATDFLTADATGALHVVSALFSDIEDGSSATESIFGVVYVGAEVEVYHFVL